MQAAVIQSLGALFVLGPIKQDARVLVEAYAPHGVSENDFAGLQVREQLLLRFPVHDRDSGLICGIPRERPPAVVPTAVERARIEATARRAPFRVARAARPDTQAVADDALLERTWSCAERMGEDAAIELLLTAIEADTLPEAQEAHIARLTARAAAHRQAQAAALAANPHQLADAALRLRELSALRYGVDPILSSAAIRVFAQRYPADLPQPRKLARSTQIGSAPTASVSPPDAGTTNPSPAASPAASEGQGAGVLVPAQEWLTLPRRVKLD